MENWLIAIFGGAAAIIIATIIIKIFSRNKSKKSIDVKIGNDATGIAIGKNINQKITKKDNKS